MKKPHHQAKPKHPAKPKPKLSGGPLVVHAPHHHKPQHPRHHAKKTPQPKHHPHKAHTVKHAAHHKKRGLALGDGWACCSAEALAASLRLAGWPVGDKDVLALHEAAGGSRDCGVPILAALETAARVGLAGIRPRGWSQFAVSGPDLTFAASECSPSIILGAELPGPHAVTVAPDGCWVSWGEHYDPADFPGAVIEEAWEVTWPGTR